MSQPAVSCSSPVPQPQRPQGRWRPRYRWLPFSTVDLRRRTRGSSRHSALACNRTATRMGKTSRIEYRWAEDRPGQIKALAAELLRRPVAAVAANSIAALSVKSLVATVPIVFQSGIDPVAAGLVASLGHPGGNATGVSFFASTMEAKKLELLRELMPAIRSRRRPGQSRAIRKPIPRSTTCRPPRRSWASR